MPTTEAPSLVVRGTELEVALGEVAAVLAAVPPGAYRERLEALSDELRGGAVGPDCALELDRLLELALQSGRVRAVYGPGGEAAATRLYRRLPSGRELAASAREVAEVLATLSGQVLEDVSITATGPGAFGLALTVGGREIAVRLDRQGARLHSVGT